MISIKHKGKKAWVNFNYTPDSEVTSVAIVSGWNDWEAENMKAKKDGSFYIRKYLPVNQQYEFRYLIDQENWENEPDASTINNSHGSQNSLLEL